MVTNVVEKIRDVFVNVQFKKSTHKSYQKKLAKIYSEVPFQLFVQGFIECLKLAMFTGERHPHIENTLRFAAKFVVAVQQPTEDDDEDQMCPLLIKLFEFLLQNHNANDPGVKFHICHFLNILLNSMGEGAFIDDNVCDQITTRMTERLMDRSAKIRAQAVLALQRLQDPHNENCQVIKVYIFHLSKDPSSEVRRAILSCMAKNPKTLHAVLKRTRDIEDSVRKLAYEFISKITVTSLTIKQRVTLLKNGLKDKSEGVLRIVRNILLPAWLSHFKWDYLPLLRALDSEIETETAVLALQAMFKRGVLEELLQQLPVDSETKLIPVEKLSSELLLYWRCLVEHLYRESCTDLVKECLPELTPFCEYIRQYLNMITSKEYGPSESSTHKFILHELFKITETYDLSDEIGRQNLSRLILDTLPNEKVSNKVAETITLYFENVNPNIDDRLNSLSQTISEIRTTEKQTVCEEISEEELCRRKIERARLKVQLNEIQEQEYEAIKNRNFLKAQSLKEELEKLTVQLDKLAEPSTATIVENVYEEKNDSVTMEKCLTIFCAALTGKSLTTLTPTLRTLLEHLVLPNTNHENAKVQILASKAVALCCLLDLKLAKHYFMAYILQFSMEQEIRGIWVVSLKAIFDLLLKYGFEAYGIDLDETNKTFEKEKSRKSGQTRLYNNGGEDLTTMSMQSGNESQVGAPNFLKILVSFMDNTDAELRTIATEGLCKLYLHRKIKGPEVLSRLLVLLFNPLTEEDGYTRQCLCAFFKLLVTKVPDGATMLGQSFLPALRMLANAPDASPLQAIEPEHMAEFILGLTDSRHRPIGRELYTIHNNVALDILTEVLESNYDIDQESLLKSLKYLNTKFEEGILKTKVQEALDVLEASLKASDPRLVKYIQKFKVKFSDVTVIEVTQENVDQTQENETQSQENEAQRQENETENPDLEDSDDDMMFDDSN